MNLEFSNHEVKRGEKHPNHKLTEQEVKPIRTYYKEGFNQQDLAEMFRVKRSTISGIITRRTWSRVV
jgi:predicted DNA-binding protein YlxM (UPF0122 family)